MSDVKVPILGNVPKPVLLGGIATVVAVGAYVFVKHKNSAATPTGNAAYGYGMAAYGYGLTNVPLEYGYGSAGYGYYGYGGSFGGLGGYGSPTPPAPVSVAPSVATTNQGWAQASANYLTGTAGMDPGAVAHALGLYITGASMNATDEGIVSAAIAFQGYPPQAGTNGYPPNINTTGTTGQTGTTPAVPGKTVAKHTITVKKGQTLQSVAAQYMPPGDAHDVTLIAHANGLGTGAGLKTGQKLIIPAH